MSNKSSIEWLMIQLYEQGLLKGDGNKMDELLDQAKAMHKEEIIDAYSDGAKGGANGGRGQHKNGWVSIQMKEKYYNETFVAQK